VIVHYNLHNLGQINNPIITIGSFDGVHIGHKKILKKLTDTAQKEKGESILFSFYPHPRQVIFPDNKSLKFLNTQQEKIELLKTTQIDHLIFFPFTIEFSKISSKEFIRKFLVEKMHIKKIIVGYDYHFGKNREGNYENLSQLGILYGFKVEKIKALNVNKIAVSSTKIRKALSEGNIKLANAFLGYEYSITGTVIKGNRIGRKLGFPTANIEVNDNCKLIPANGVYIAHVNVNKKLYNGMVNIGIRPTLNLKEITIEVNIFDFDADIYNQQITISLVDRIRDEVKFHDLDALKIQLVKDKAEILKKIDQI